ncbi:hypothetical protein IV417_14430 [Alphaproteobacteria bacterium KMM 3653]|uniref:Peptidase M48 domain-containing protein n=1 Tax=Harenicola maris TaxID=2841044 RepID=A0AAP2CR45_9RHOB|nr:hypothetical protein [Harenicola maris]
MTALEQYARLETAGVWRSAPGEPRINVTVTFGDATLTIADQRGERVLSHWSLAAVERVNPGEEPALYAPSAEASELLELEDDLMVEAVERVRRVIKRARPRPGWLRRGLLWGGCAALAYLAVFWLPGALTDHTVRSLPQPVRAEVGSQVFRAITRISGQPCRSPLGDRALARLHTRLVAPEKGGLLVLPAGVDQSLSLPGGLILLNRALVEDFESPEVVAGFVLAERARSAKEDPLYRLLDFAGLRATIRLLTTGKMDPALLEAYGEHVLAQPEAPIDEETLLAMFEKRSFSSKPYAYARDVSGETVLTLIEADPMRTSVARPVLSDANWVALQGICGE